VRVPAREEARKSQVRHPSSCPPPRTRTGTRGGGASSGADGHYRTSHAPHASMRHANPRIAGRDCAPGSTSSVPRWTAPATVAGLVESAEICEHAGGGGATRLRSRRRGEAASAKDGAECSGRPFHPPPVGRTYRRRSNGGIAKRQGRNLVTHPPWVSITRGQDARQNDLGHGWRRFKRQAQPPVQVHGTFAGSRLRPCGAPCPVADRTRIGNLLRPGGHDLQAREIRGSPRR